MKKYIHKENIIMQNNKIGRIYWINLGLMGLVVTMFLFYIFNMNKMADLKYKMSVLRKDLARENIDNSNTSSQDSDSLGRVLVFARQKGMVEVKNYDSFFEENGVALRP